MPKKYKFPILKGKRKDTSEFVKPENLEKMFLYQELLGRGLEQWKKKNQQ